MIAMTLFNFSSPPYSLGNHLKTFSMFLLSLVIASCSGVPEGIKAIENFDGDEYMGQWYEIARLDHSFERNLDQVTANYRSNDDGSIAVVNRGFDADKQQWQQAEGKAVFVGQSDIGHLKVSFFGRKKYRHWPIFEKNLAARKSAWLNFTC